MSNIQENGFVLIGGFIKKRVSKRLFSATLWAYFIGAIVFFGGAGVWLSFIHIYSPELLDRSELLLSILSFSWAVAGASCTDFIFGESENYVRTIPIYAALLVIILTIISITWEPVQYLFSVLAAFVAFLLWWIANAENPKLLDTTNPDVPTGGTLDSGKMGVSGDIKI